jgi:hypothetical protein
VLRDLGDGLRSVQKGLREEIFVISDQFLFQILMGMDKLAIGGG